MDIRLRNIVLLLVKKHFKPCSVGRKRVDPDLILDELLHILWSGSPWRALRSQSVSYQTVHRYFMLWRDKSIFKEAYTIAYRLQNRQVRRSKRYQCIDASFVKNVYGRDCVRRNPTDRGRMATKLSALVDQDGLPLSLVFFPANCNDMKTVKQTLDEKILHTNSQPLYADKGYDSRAVRATMQQHGYIDRVGKRRTVVHRLVNRRRNVVERFFSWLDKSRRLIMRYDAHIASYESWTWLACLRLLYR